MRWALLLPLLLACESAEPEPTVRPCSALLGNDGVPGSAEDLEELLALVQGELYPQLAAVTIDLETGRSDDSYFWAQIDLGTLSARPLERRYLVFHASSLFDDPPSNDAVIAILAHELKHVLDYTELEEQELAEFVAWYMQGDVADYERETDLRSLELGCGPGLIEFRDWLYEHVDDEVEEQKRRDYYSPEEIRAWMASNP